jgi:hypothetical protein
MWAALAMIAAMMASGSVADMKHHRRVLIIAAPTAGDATLAAQRRQLAGWRQGADDRDLSVVEVIGDHVSGATDAAAALRHRYDLPAAHFRAVLIGKDGHVAMREGQPIPADRLEATIDAMPMRRAGLR